MRQAVPVSARQAEVWPRHWQWQLLIESDGLRVVHVCDRTAEEEPLEFEPDECVVWCPLCGQGLSVLRTEEWGQ